jgi:hypothetical protein
MFHKKHARRIPIAAMLTFAAVTSACAHAAAARETVGPGERSSRYVLVPADIEKAKADNVYDVIVKLRPEFLRAHGDPNGFYNQAIQAGKGDPGAAGTGVSSSVGAAVTSGPQPVIAYRDKLRLSSVDDLKLIPLVNIAEIRYIPGPEAGVKYGTNHSGGVIVVTSK